jgi:outer membrane protein assembly factor BamB
MLIRSFFLTTALAFSAEDDWSRWRGPNNDGMARGDVPLEWSETKNIAWKATIPGRGHSSPVIWGNKLFLTTAAPIRQAAQADQQSSSQGRSGRGGAGGGAGLGSDYSFRLMCFDRNSGKLLWDKEAVQSTPHEGYHARYGSFASNTPVTDGKHVIAFFG